MVASKYATIIQHTLCITSWTNNFLRDHRMSSQNIKLSSSLLKNFCIAVKYPIRQPEHVDILCKQQQQNVVEASLIASLIT